eukprot:10172449-Heterocapsa_arctica.AAC.1
MTNSNVRKLKLSSISSSRPSDGQTLLRRRPRVSVARPPSRSVLAGVPSGQPASSSRPDQQSSQSESGL